MSLRAQEALQTADVILCEDTRRTAQLLSGLHLTRTGKLERLDAHATRSHIDRWVDQLKDGASIALVTDGGTPGISDPGSSFVAAARLGGVRITPVPGPSAVTALLSVAGMSATDFQFLGFFPRKTTEGQEVLNQLTQSHAPAITIWYESPKRIRKTLELLALNHPEAQVVAAKELTKVFEKFFSGTSVQVRNQVVIETETEGELGEWCFAVFLPTEVRRSEQSSDWVKALHCLLDARVLASEAARQVSQHFGAPKKEVYEAALKFLGKKY